MPKVIFLNIVEVHTDENNNCNINKVSNHFKVINQHVISWGEKTRYILIPIMLIMLINLFYLVRGL